MISEPNVMHEYVRSAQSVSRTGPDPYERYRNRIECGRVRLGTRHGRLAVDIIRARNRLWKCPVYVHLHAGDQSHSDAELRAGFFAKIASVIDGLVVSLTCRLTPNDPFSAALDEAYALVEWIAMHAAELDINPSHIMIGGDGTGAGLAAAVSVQGALKGDFGILRQFILDPVADEAATILNRLSESAGMHLIDRPLDCILPNAILILAGQNSRLRGSKELASQLKSMGALVTARTFHASHPGFVLRADDEWEDAHMMIALNMLFAIRQTDS